MSSFRWLINPAAAHFIKRPLVILCLVFAALLIVSVLLIVSAIKRENGDD